MDFSILKEVLEKRNSRLSKIDKDILELEKLLTEVEFESFHVDCDIYENKDILNKSIFWDKKTKRIFIRPRRDERAIPMIDSPFILKEHFYDYIQDFCDEILKKWL